MILISSVPHSGQHFIQAFLHDVLKVKGHRRIGTPDRAFFEQAGDYLQVPSNMHRWHGDLADYSLTDHFDSLVITLRHPHQTYLTHVRGKPVDPRIPALEVEQYALYWHDLIALAGAFDTVIVPIDAQEDQREQNLLNVAKLFGKRKTKAITEYARAWAPINASGRPDRALAQEEIDTLQFAVDWYEGQI